MNFNIYKRYEFKILPSLSKSSLQKKKDKYIKMYGYYEFNEYIFIKF